MQWHRNPVFVSTDSALSHLPTALGCDIRSVRHTARLLIVTTEKSSGLWESSSQILPGVIGGRIGTVNHINYIF